MPEQEPIDVSIKLKHKISEIQCNEQAPSERFKVKANDQKFSAPALIISTGGLSIPTMGATGFGYQVAQQFGHHIHPTRASLVPLTWNSKDKLRFENLSGMALSAKVQMHQQSFEHKILFTHRGLSGPSILQISNYWQPGNHINIDFLPSNNISSLIEQALQENSKQTLKQLIKGLWPARWIDSWFSCELLNKQLAQLSKQNMSTLEQMIHHWVFSPGGDEGYRTAEVTIGGVDCNEVSSKTMQSQLQSGLFFAGEVLDVTGHLGGFNFQWAWSSGFVAGAHC